jgi:predicted ribosome quality control (RQC) complex YloA/Tae2 family protein
VIKQELGIEQIKQKKQRKMVVQKISLNGFEVYIGKNNKQNDYIISKLAKNEDIWFHVHNCAGSHILLKCNGIEPDEETIFECCKLARKYSSATMPSKIGVIYTRAKNLRKPPSSPLGYVTYKNEKEVLI